MKQSHIRKFPTGGKLIFDGNEEITYVRPGRSKNMHIIIRANGFQDCCSVARPEKPAKEDSEKVPA